MKRLFSLVLTFAVAMTSLTAFVGAETKTEAELVKEWKSAYKELYGSYELKQLENNFCEYKDGWVYDSYMGQVIGYYGTDSEITLPRKICGKTAYAEDFLCSDYVIKLTIPKKFYFEYGSLDYSKRITANSLETIEVASDHDRYTSIDGVLYSKYVSDGETIIRGALKYPSAKKDENFVLPLEIQGIADGFINGNPYLKTLTIQKGVTSVGLHSLNMPNLEKLYLKNGKISKYDFWSKTGSMSWDVTDLNAPNATVYCLKNSGVEQWLNGEYEVGEDSESIVCIRGIEYKSIEYLEPAKTPSKPVIKSTSYTTKGIKLTVKDYNAKGIKVYRKSGKTYKYIGYTNGKTFYDKTAKAGKTYSYKLRAYNKKYGAAANSKYSAVVKVTAKPKTPKATTVKSLSFTKKKGVKVTVKDYNAKGVKVYRKSGGKYKYLGYTKSKVFYDKTAKKGKTYTYKVRTYNKINGVAANSKYSKTKTIKTK